MSVADFTVGTTCDCNGHGGSCDLVEGTGYVCDCGRNTTGRTCEQCLPLYNDSPWSSAGNASDAAMCGRCQCNSHAASCQFDPAKNHGVCNCMHDTVGDRCELCAPGFYRNSSVEHDSPLSCIPCECSPAGSSSDVCNHTTGACLCNEHFVGRPCDQCAPGRFLNTTDDPRCQLCECSPAGTLRNDSCNFDPRNGSCNCKSEFGGPRCSECIEGYYNNSRPNSEGHFECQACNSLCEGGCTGPGTELCNRCAQFKHGQNCVSTCPTSTLADSGAICQACSDTSLCGSFFRPEAVPLSISEASQVRTRMGRFEASDLDESLATVFNYTLRSSVYRGAQILPPNGVGSLRGSQQAVARAKVNLPNTTACSTTTSMISIDSDVFVTSSNVTFNGSFSVAVAVFQESNASGYLWSYTDNDHRVLSLLWLGSAGLHLFYSTTASTTHVHRVDHRLSTNRWHHIVVSVDNMNGGIHMYADLDLISSFTIEGRLHAAAQPELTIGRRSASNSAHTFVGKVAQLAYFSGAVVVGWPSSRQTPFEIDATTGELTVADTLDRETDDHYIITVEARNESRSALRVVPVCVLDVNDNNPVIQVASSVTPVLENATIGTVINTFEVSDPDDGSNGSVTVSLQGPSAELFSVDSNAVTVEGALNRSVQASHVVTLVATDGGGLVSKLNFTVNVIDVNDCDPVFYGFANPLQISVPETQSIGAPFVNITAIDCDFDENGRVSYNITEHPSFAVNSSTGAVFVTKLLDFEAGPRSFELTVTALDHGDPPRSGQLGFVVSVADKNDNAPQFVSDAYRFNVAEESPINTVVGHVRATDADISEEFRAVRYINNLQGVPFRVDTVTGAIFVSGRLDFETVAGYSFNVSCADSDRNPNFGVTNVTVNVTDVNRAPPVFDDFPDDVILVVENSTVPGGTIAVFRGIDSEIASDDLQFSLVGGNIDSVFVMVGPNLTLAQGRVLDREIIPTYNLSLAVSDGSAQTVATVLINVTDINDNLPVLGNLGFDVGEDVPNGTLVGQLTADDRDVGLFGTVTFASDDSAPFWINVTSGDIVVIAPLDRELVSSYSFLVSAIDGGSQASQGTATIIVLDANEESRFSRPVDSIGVPENAPVGSTVYTLNATDRDLEANGTLSYSTVSNNCSLYFAVISDTGDVVLRSALDYETVPVCQLRVIATDGGTPPLNSSNVAALIIRVQDVNDNAPQFRGVPIKFEASEAAAVNTVVGRIQADDRDSGVNAVVRYTVQSTTTDGGQHPFRVDANSGNLTLVGDLDREVVQSYNLVVVATDQGNPSMSNSTEVLINVSDVNDESPSARIVLNNTIYENSGNGTVVGVIHALDRDAGLNGTLQFDVIVGDDYFAVDEDGTLTVSTGLVLDREVLEPIDVSVRVSDLGTPSRATVATAQVVLEDLNDNRPVLIVRNAELFLPEDAPVTFEIDTVSARDADVRENGLVDFVFDDECKQDFFVSSDGAVGRIQVRRLQDSEERFQYRCLLYAIDRGTPQLNSSQWLTIQVNDVNEYAPSVSYPNPINNRLELNLTETNSTRTTLATLRASDGDLFGTPLSFRLADSGNFQVNAVTGALSITTPLDAESGNALQYNMTLTIGDARTSLPERRFVSYPLMITVLDANEFAPQVDLNQSQFVFVERSQSPLNVTHHIRLTDADLTPASLARADITLSRVDQINQEVLAVDLDVAASVGLTVSQRVSANAIRVLTVEAPESGANFESFVAVLETVTYLNGVAEPSRTDRQICLRVIDVDDKEGSSCLSVSVDLVRNFTPLLSPSRIQLNWTEGGDAINVTGSALQVVDRDSGDLNLTNATIQVVDSLENEDEYLFIDDGDCPSQLQCSFSNVSATLTIRGPATASVYQSAMEHVYYQNDAVEPAAIARVIRLQVNHESQASNVALSTIAVALSNDPPVISFTNGTASVSTTFEEGSDGIFVFPNVSVSDVDNRSISVFEVSLVDGALWHANETLAVESLYGINVSYQSTSPVLTLRGDGTVDEYADIISTITYGFAFDDSPFSERILKVRVSDGLDWSTEATSAVTIRGVDDPPIADLNGPSHPGLNFETEFVEGGPAVPIGSPELSIFDVDEVNIDSVLVALDPDATSHETLTGSVTDLVNAQVGDGSIHMRRWRGSPVDAFQLALRRLSFNVTIAEPERRNAVVFVTLFHGSINRTTQTNVTITGLNDAPALDLDVGAPGTGYNATFTEGFLAVGDPVDLTGILSLVDSDTTNVTLVRIVVEDALDGSLDRILWNESALQSVDITAVNATSGTTVTYALTIEQGLTLNNTRALLNSLQYCNFAAEPTDASPRSVTLFLLDVGSEAPEQWINASIVVNVVSVNDNGPVFEESTFVIDFFETNQTAVAVTQLQARDNDRGVGSAIQYSISASPTFQAAPGVTGLYVSQNFPFVIDSDSGIITTSGFVDRERVVWYQLAVTATDDGGLNNTCFVRIQIEDINEFGPTFTRSTANVTVAENFVGTIYRLTASDQDGNTAENSLTFDHSSTGPEINGVVTDGGYELTTDGSLNREEVESFTVTVVVTDLGADDGFVRAVELNITINISDENDNAPVFDLVLDSLVLAEDHAVGSIVYRLNVSDEDTLPNAVPRFHLLESRAGPFTVNISTGVVTLGAPLDREGQGFYGLLISANNTRAFVGATAPGAFQLQVNVTDVNDSPPRFLNPPSTVTVVENSSPGGLLAEFRVTDDDIGDNARLRFTVESQSSCANFSYVADQELLRLHAVQSFDREDTENCTFTIVARDSGEPVQTSNVTIVLVVEDENDNTPVFAQDLYADAVAEDARVGHFIVQIEANDPDKGANGTIMYEFEGSGAEIFGVNASGAVIVAAQLDRESISRFNLTLRATDGERSSETTLIVIILVSCAS